MSWEHKGRSISQAVTVEKTSLRRWCLDTTSNNQIGVDVETKAGRVVPGTGECIPSFAILI